MDEGTLRIAVGRMSRIIPGVDFRIVARNEVGKIQLKNSPMMIFANTKDRSQLGHHWVLFYYDGQSLAIEYFDSFGEDPVYYGIELCTQGKQLIWKPAPIQPPWSGLGGAFCLLFGFNRLYYCSCISRLDLVDNFFQGTEEENLETFRQMYETVYKNLRMDKIRSCQKKETN